jgi:hypothetical protein
LNEELLELALRIRSELNSIERTVERSQAAWQHFLESDSPFLIGSSALNLHGFYTGTESLFEAIISDVDRSFPEGKTWHQTLLKQMAIDLPTIRPSVISEDSRIALDEYRKFRHVVRHIYSFNIRVARLKPLIEGVAPVFDQVRDELLAFADFLEGQHNAS